MTLIFNYLEMRKDLNKFLWVMVWWAVWDALWAPVEFLWIDEFERVDNYREWNWLNPGERTDDTAMALILAESLVKRKWFNIEDQLEWYFKWHKTGYMWLRDFPQWEWMQISKMLMFYWMYKEWAFTDKPRETDLSWEHMDWNGSLMRIWPVPLFFRCDKELAMERAWDSSKATHYTDLCVDACTYYSWLIWWAMKWLSKNELLDPRLESDDFFKDHNFPEPIKKVIEWSYKKKDRYQINPSGYVVESLEAALWWFYNSKDFRDWMEKVVNLWWDADTIWCIYWYLAWAYYWYDNIPQEWKDWLVQREKIESLAKQLYDMPNFINISPSDFPWKDVEDSMKKYKGDVKQIRKECPCCWKHLLFIHFRSPDVTRKHMCWKEWSMNVCLNCKRCYNFNEKCKFN